MTDARLPGRWLFDPRMEDLSDRAWRTFTSALMWSAEHGTDGQLPARSLRLFHPDGVDEATTKELVEAGVWLSVGSDYQIVDWEKTQALAIDVEWQRERNRRKNRAARDRARGESSSPVTGHDPGQVTGHAGGQDRIGLLSTKNKELTTLADSENVTGDVTGHVDGKAKTQQRDELFDAIAEACGINLDQLTTPSRGALNKARKELAAVGATPADVHARARIYRDKYGAEKLTASALAKHWPQLQASGRGTKQITSWSPDDWENPGQQRYQTW